MIVTLSNAPRDYAWGSSTLIADLEGRAPSGRPEAETWFGDHPASPALVGAPGSPTLDAWLTARGERPLPYLLKLLAAAAPLSIQVHPSKAEAEAGFAAEEASGLARDDAARNYRDDNHKPEILVALSARFDALAGLRPVAASRALVEALGVPALADRLAGDDDADVLADVLAWVLGEGDEVTAAVGAALQSPDAAARAAFAAEPTASLEALTRVAAMNPGDPGVVVALLMNHVSLGTGEAVYLPAGILHAYLSGLGVELMAASDNVLRGGLTPKHIDVAELLRIVDTRPSAPPLLAPVVSGAVRRYAPAIPDFALTRVSLEGGAVEVPISGPAIVLATAGTPSVAGGEAATCIALVPGGAVFLTADESVVRLSGVGEAFVAEPGGNAG
ncbi:MAG: mannose-6-phosphate isomerase, class I [Microbacterium ginsengisoli]|nr:mannose-6-phosphate isomerase, class I [Microbacterium ginsengisoli]